MYFESKSHPWSPTFYTLAPTNPNLGVENCKYVIKGVNQGLNHIQSKSLNIVPSYGIQVYNCSHNINVLEMCINTISHVR
jgi:hypothetical protein